MKEVIDEMGLVVPSEPNGKIGEVYVGVRLDLEGGLRQSVATQPTKRRKRWTVMTRVEDVSPEERDRRPAEWATENV